MGVMLLALIATYRLPRHHRKAARDGPMQFPPVSRCESFLPNSNLGASASVVTSRPEATARSKDPSPRRIPRNHRAPHLQTTSETLVPATTSRCGSTHQVSNAVQSDVELGGSSAVRSGVKRKYTFVNRSQRQPTIDSNFKERRARIAAVVDMSKERCCSRRTCFAVVDQKYLRAQKSRLLAMNRMYRKAALTDMLRGNDFWFNSNIVCTVFLIKALGFSRNLQAAVKELPCENASSSITVIPRQCDDRSQRIFGFGFLEHASQSIADKMHDPDEVHLPSFRKLDVYMAFREQFSEKNNEEEPL